MSLSKRNTAIVCTILIAIAICGLTPTSNADIIHESATMGAIDQYQGYGIEQYQFRGSRFEITETTEITAIGGHIATENDDRLIFGAIVSLNSSSDLPPGFPFWTSKSEVVAWTYFNPPWWSFDMRIPLNVILEPGWYGLVFGTGQFGSLNRFARSVMPYINQTNLSGNSYFIWNGSTWSNIAYSSASYPRFVVEGQPFIPPVEIHGTKFNDIDGDGFWDSSEPNMPGWEIYLDENNNGNYDASEPNTITDAIGMYRVTDLDTPATYRVREVARIGWTQTMPGGPGNGYVINAEPNHIYGPFDFGNTDQPIPVGIILSGYVRTSGVRIKGINISASTGETTLTDALGYYELTVPSPFSGTITPSQTDWTFSPALRPYSNTTTDQFNQDFTATYSVSFGGGSGTSGDPFRIYTAEQMNAIGANLPSWLSHFKLMDDIDLGGFDGEGGNPSFNRIGYYIDLVGDYAFTGVFDGNGHTISNFTFDSDTGKDGVGIFGYVNTSGAQIKNVKLYNIDVNSTSSTGTAGLIGFLSNGTISGCSVEGGSAHGVRNVGGLAGSIFDGTITDCSVDDVTVTGDTWIAGLLGGVHGSGVVVSDCSASCSVTAKLEGGGLIGRMEGSTTRCTSTGTVSINYEGTSDRTAGGLIGDNRGAIDQCYSTANVVGNGSYEIGGMVGRNKGIILNSYATGDVSGVYPTGGLIGVNWEDFSEASITNCYSIGASTGGGLIGWNVDGTGLITNSFWDELISGTTSSDGGTGLSTTDIQNRQTFLDAGWDFVNETANGTEDIWHMPYGAVGSPKLWWHRDILGDWIGKYGVGVEDYAVLAGSWMNINAEINLSGPDIIDFEDLAVFLGNWSAGR